MIQNDTLDPSEVNKMNTPALERLFIEMSNASTTLMNNYGAFEMPNGNVNTNLSQLDDGTTGSVSNVTNPNNINTTCSYGGLNPLSYPSIPNTSDNDIQQQLNSTVSHHHQHHLHHHQHHQQHVTNPVFHSDSILTESLPGSIHHHRSSRSSPDYSNRNDTNGTHSHNSSSIATSNHEGGYQVHESLAQPIVNNLSTPMPPSPISLMTLSSLSNTLQNGAPSTTPLGLQSVKNESNLVDSNNGLRNSSTTGKNANSSINCLKNVPHNQQLSSSTISPPVSPIDMEEQEKVKLERKRQRNRIAASKCRKRKLEKIHLLEKRVNELKDENEQLSTKVNKLRDHVCCLKREVIQHINSGCPISSPDHPI